MKNDIAQHIKKAGKCVGKDELRPVFHHILIEFGNGLMRIAGTDAHRLYYSNKIECSFAATKQFVILGDFSKVKKATEKAKESLLKSGLILTGLAWVMLCAIIIIQGIEWANKTAKQAASVKIKL